MICVSLSQTAAPRARVLRGGLAAPILAACATLLAESALAGTPPPPAVRFVDVTARTGITFRHRACRTPEKRLPEVMGSGVALLDADGDGRLDLYFVQQGPLGAGGEGAGELWHNDGGWRFSRVPGAGGAPGGGTGMGACVGDVDGDGLADLVVTNVGSLALYRNTGHGGFARVRDAGLDDVAFHASCTFADVDGDGDLDLYVTGYVDFPAQGAPFCGDLQRHLRAYCRPDMFKPARDRLYVNDGHGHFTEASAAAGLGGETGKGLGVIATDVNLDGAPDFVVADDMTPNTLWLNDGHGRFRETGLASGLAYGENGVAQAGMGVVAALLNDDFRPDVVVTNFDAEPNTVWLSEADGRWRDATGACGLATASLGPLGFGIEAFDYDFDGDVDLYVANGHVIDNIAEFHAGMTFAQRDQLFVNDGQARFHLAAGAEAGDVGREAAVGRGVAAGDLDGDGDLDLVVTRNDGPPLLLENRGAELRPHVVLDLRGTRSNREAYGARVLLRPRGARTPSGPRVAAEVQAARSYCSQGTRLLHLACPWGASDALVAWPSGLSEAFLDLAPGPRVLTEGTGVPPPDGLALVGFLPSRPSSR